MNTELNFTTIAISRKNYELLKDIGKFGESFNDILSKLLDNKKGSKEE
jgi:predicted CopG family antitoxin